MSLQLRYYHILDIFNKKTKGLSFSFYKCDQRAFVINIGSSYRGRARLSLVQQLLKFHHCTSE